MPVSSHISKMGGSILIKSYTSDLLHKGKNTNVYF